MKALICTTPRLMNTGKKLRSTVRNVSVRKVEYRPQPPDEPEHSRKLDDKLEGATDN